MKAKTSNSTPLQSFIRPKNIWTIKDNPSLTAETLRQTYAEKGIKIGETANLFLEETPPTEKTYKIVLLEVSQLSKKEFVPYKEVCAIAQTMDLYPTSLRVPFLLREAFEDQIQGEWFTVSISSLEKDYTPYVNLWQENEILHVGAGQCLCVKNFFKSNLIAFEAKTINLFEI